MLSVKYADLFHWADAAILLAEFLLRLDDRGVRDLDRE